MGIKFIYDFNEMYGKIRYFKADRCINNDAIKEFNKYKIHAEELVAFDCALFNLEEINQYDENCDAFQIMAVIIKPDIDLINSINELNDFEFCGYDLVEADTIISAITNCGAEFDDAVDYEKLNQYGLISAYSEAVRTQTALEKYYPDENHAYCEIVAVWRKVL